MILDWQMSIRYNSLSIVRVCVQLLRTSDSEAFQFGPVNTREKVQKRGWVPVSRDRASVAQAVVVLVQRAQGQSQVLSQRLGLALAAALHGAQLLAHLAVALAHAALLLTHTPQI